MNITAPDKDVKIISIIATENKLDRSEVRGSYLSYQKESSTHYTINQMTNTSGKNDYITLNVNYDPNWKIIAKNKEVAKSFRGNESFNTFQIPLNINTEDYEIVFSLQIFRSSALIIVFFFTVLQVTYFAFYFHVLEELRTKDKESKREI